MKELKLRAFDKDLKEIFDVEIIDFKNKIIMRKNNDWYNLKDCEIMEYTGLKDNTKWEELTKEEQQEWLDTGKEKEEWNGKEIYEGDIITAMFEKILPAVVVENHGAFRLKRPDRKALKHIGNKVDKQLSKIIGNICQNPELLNKSQ